LQGILEQQQVIVLDDPRRPSDDPPPFVAAATTGTGASPSHLIAVRSGSARRGPASDLIVETSLEERLAQLKADLAGPSPSPLELQIVDQVAVAWLATCYAALFDAVAAGGSDHTGQREEAQRRHDRAQRRHLAALKSLATVRKLLRPTCSPVDLLMRDVAESAVPNGGGGRMRTAAGAR
jgi:hypothetical protein